VAIGAGEGKASFHGSATAGVNVERQDWKELFKELGVEWPARSSIKYMATIARSWWRTRPITSRCFESVLATLNVVPKQIEIEARFVEVNQTDLSSLGFEWMLTERLGDGLPRRTRRTCRRQPASGSSWRRTPPRGASRRATATCRLRSATVAGGVADSLVTVASVLTNPELTAILHALERKGNADLLSAPKVTTQSGKRGDDQSGHRVHLSDGLSR